VEQTIQRNMTGGPAIVWDRVVNDRKVLTYDANSLYGWAMSQDLPVGRNLFELDEEGHRVLGKRKGSLGERSWIASLRAQGIQVSTADELPTKRIRVKGASGASYIPDGVDRPNRTVYEYFGDHWHDDEGAQARVQDLEKAGWRVVVMWERNWATPDRLDAAAKEYYPAYSHLFYRCKDARAWLAPTRVTRAIVDGVLFRFALVDSAWTRPDPPAPVTWHLLQGQ
jgi:hypothetical protein